MLTIGDNEVNAKTVSVRTRKGEDQGVMNLDDLLAKLGKEIEDKVRE